MKPSNPRILTINGGSSSIKFALYQMSEPLECRLYGKIDRIGMDNSTMSFGKRTDTPLVSQSIAAIDYDSAANSLIDWLETQEEFASITAVGHRIVHGMSHTEPEMVTQELLDDLHRIEPYDPDHLPGEIKLIRT
ncbi:MAG: acetate/propionate family kinase, partial [Chthoniobacterales bacterium]